MANVFSSAAELFAAQGKDLGVTDWIQVTQKQIDQFADATGDHQWIHVDPVRAKGGPFGACIAHGYLTLALVNVFLPELVKVENMKMGVNVGCDRVRFPSPVRVGSRLRGRGEMVKVEQIGAAVQTTVRVTVEIEGAERPGCVVDTVSRYTFA